MSLPKVLVVDDMASARAVILTALEPLGYSVREAANAAEALQIATAWEPDVILLDVMMPGTSGLDVCRMLRANPVTREAPVVIVTSLTDRETRIEALAAGADEVLTKPVDRAELRLRVQSICRLNRYRLLLEERARVASLIETSLVPTLVVSLEGECRYANESGEQLFGVAVPGEARDRSRASSLEPAVMQVLGRAREEAAAMRRSVRVPAAQLGMEQALTEVVVDAIDWQGSDAIRVEGVDARRLADMERTLRHRERLASLGQLSASTTHEIASVLTIIDLALRDLDTAGPEAEAARASIRGAVTRGSRLVRQLLAFSRPSASAGSATTGAALRDTVLPGIALLMPRRLELTVDVEDAVVLPLSQTDLEQVMVNLSANAYEAGATAITVSARALDDGGCELVVADNGRGVDPAVATRLGEPFVTTRSTLGHGLGVWTVRRIVEERGGSLRYDPNPTGGTRARCTFVAIRP